jgi:hypothetical protein
MVAIVGKLIVAAAGALVGAAVARELDKPVDQRGWHGEVGGIPYDFRRPDAEKLRRSAWDPDNPDVLVPHAFGVGWSINFARVADWIQPPPAAVPAPGQPELAPAPPKPELAAAPAGSVAAPVPGVAAVVEPVAAPVPGVAAVAEPVAAPVPGLAAVAEPETVVVPGMAAGPDPETAPAPGTASVPEVVVEPDTAAVPITPASTAEPDAPDTPSTPVADSRG